MATCLRVSRAALRIWPTTIVRCSGTAPCYSPPVTVELHRASPPSPAYKDSGYYWKHYSTSAFMAESSDILPYAIKGLSHIAVVVPDLMKAAEHYRNAFGAKVCHTVEKPDHGVTVVFLQLPNLTIELLHPLGDSSPVAKFLQKNPKGGIHHVCLAVNDVDSAAGHLRGLGVQSLGSGDPKAGAENKPVLFLNPRDNMGVLIELQQED